MSSLSYPLFSARRCALVGAVAGLVGSVWGAPVFTPSSSDIAGVTLQSTTPASGGTGAGGYASSFGFTSSTGSTRTVRFNFTGLYLYGGQFIDLSTLAPGLPSNEALQGTLLSVGINIQANSFSGEPIPSGGADQTYSSDLTILVAKRAGSNPSIDNSSGPEVLVQAGGLTDFLSGGSLIERYNWSSSATGPADAVVDTYSLVNSIALTSSASDPAIWLGHGFMSSALANEDTWGTWDGYVELSFVGSGGSGVPDGSRTALLLAPGTLLLLGLAGRSRRRD